MSSDNIYNLFLNSGAVLHGHFILSSGLHSDYFVQCARVLEKSQNVQLLASNIIREIHTSVNIQDVHYVISPAVGGLIIGYEVARQIGSNFVFCERIDKKFSLEKRGFQIKPNSNCVIIEDVVTTAGTSIEMINYLHSLGLNLNMCIEGCLVDRSGDVGTKNLQSVHVKLISLLKLNIRTFYSDDIPDNLRNVPAVALGTKQRTY
ncbi:MAG: orotate phosphoribosyltransferase [Candidatus Xenolissoclinum pacificiensis L6]|uniref:Orotate phosphoribosyltransferase n=1 Tax=Candidatus Xenolissoclinum pacificiensis L6 TaxID=1401685 RepID=W2V343_9RICK|nr:MAG: orotate phosphoribosyltransferase [Candidatus Xenolissoclinum pacificiensis L6]